MKIWSNEFGITPRSSGSERTPEHEIWIIRILAIRNNDPSKPFVAILEGCFRYIFLNNSESKHSLVMKFCQIMYYKKKNMKNVTW